MNAGKSLAMAYALRRKKMNVQDVKRPAKPLLSAKSIVSAIMSKRPKEPDPEEELNLEPEEDTLFEEIEFPDDMPQEPELVVEEKDPKKTRIAEIINRKR